jgi:1-acyl-sn-glycerol-3-phosphate acyltransferase
VKRPITGLSLVLVLCGLSLPAFAGSAPPAVEVLKSNLDQLDQQLVPLEKAVLASEPPFWKAYDGIAAQNLTAEQARTAHEGHADALPEPARVAIDAALPAMRRHQDDLWHYFQAYDKWATAQMDHRIGSLTQSMLDARKELATKLSEGALSSLDKRIAKAQVHPDEFWATKGITHGPRSMYRLAATRNFAIASLAAETEIHRLRHKAGMEPARTWGQSINIAVTKIHREAVNLRVRATLAAPFVKLISYLLNPFRKTPDPDRIANILKEAGQTFLARGKVEIESVGKERIPTGKKIIYTPSHRSDYVDSMTSVSTFEGPRLTPINAVTFYPAWSREIIAKLFRDEPGVILTNVPGEDVVARCVQAIKDGRTLLFFPEGNRPGAESSIRPMRAGLEPVTRATLDEDLAIVPVTFVDPMNPYGQPTYAHGERELGLKVKVVYDRPINPRVVYAISRGTSHLLLNLVRMNYHRNLVPRMREAVQPAQSESISGPSGYRGELPEVGD